MRMNGKKKKQKRLVSQQLIQKDKKIVKTNKIKAKMFPLKIYYLRLELLIKLIKLLY